MSQNATSTELLEVQIPPHVLIDDWDPLVLCIKRTKIGDNDNNMKTVFLLHNNII